MPRVANIADIIKIKTIVSKTTFKDSGKFKRFRNDVSKYNLYMFFSIQQKLGISSEKMLMSAELKVCFTSFIYFVFLFR